MFKFDCPACQRPLSGTDQIVGQAVQCPFCLSSITIPLPPPAPPPDPIPAAQYSLFTDEFRNRLRHGKYTSGWAERLKEEHLEALLMAVGEYGCRSEQMLEILRQHMPSGSQSYARAMLALEILAEFSNGNPINRERLWERVRQALEDVRAIQESRPPTETGTQL